jgi:hypothetical protein
MDGEYLVYHGCAGHLGRFHAAGPGGFGRGAAVVVHSRRGLELGEVLCLSRPDRPTLPDPVVGELLRPASGDDLAAADRHRLLGRQVFDDGSQWAEAHALPLALVDVEVFLDGRQALLHAVRFGTCDEGPLLSDLGDRHGLIVRLYDLHGDATVETEDEHGCGSCGSGSSGGCGEGGCSSGGCGSCSAGGAKELTNYFAGLREQMEQVHRVALL